MAGCPPVPAKESDIESVRFRRGWFGKLVACLVLSDGAGAEVLLRQLELRDLVLWEAGLRLQRSGCSRFVSVAKALLDEGRVLGSKDAVRR